MLVVVWQYPLFAAPRRAQARALAILAALARRYSDDKTTHHWCAIALQVRSMMDGEQMTFFLTPERHSPRPRPLLADAR